MELDAKLLIKNLRKIPEDENEISEKAKKMKCLLSVLAGDQRVIQDLSMDDIAELFAETPSILSGYDQDVSTHFCESRLENFRCMELRAV